MLRVQVHFSSSVERNLSQIQRGSGCGESDPVFPEVPREKPDDLEVKWIRTWSRTTLGKYPDAVPSRVPDHGVSHRSPGGEHWPFCGRRPRSLSGLIQKPIIPADQRRSKPLQMTGLSLDLRLQHVSAASEILPRPHGLAARLRNVHGNKSSIAVPSSNGANYDPRGSGIGRSTWSEPWDRQPWAS